MRSRGSPCTVGHHPSLGGLPMQPTAVRARGLTKTFGDVIALDGVDLDVSAGQIHGLVGPNGAGKTTLLGLLLGLAVADDGTLEIFGTPVGRALAASGGCRGVRRRPRSLPDPDCAPEPRRARIPPRRGRRSVRRRRRAARPGRARARWRATLSVASRSACGSASGWPQPCSGSRGCWSSTSRPTASTRPASGRSTGC